MPSSWLAGSVALCLDGHCRYTALATDRTDQGRHPRRPSSFEGSQLPCYPNPHISLSVVTLRSFACHAAVTRASRPPGLLLTRHLARWLSVERSARLLAYPMRSSGVSRYVIVAVFVPFRHAPSLADPAPARLCDKSLCRRAASRQGVNELPARRVPGRPVGFPPRGRGGLPGGPGPSQARHGSQGPDRGLLGARWRQATTQLPGAQAAPPTRPRLGAPTPTTRSRLTALAPVRSLFLRAVANDSDAYERGYANEPAEF